MIAIGSDHGGYKLKEEIKKYEAEYETIKEIEEKYRDSKNKPSIIDMCQILDVKRANYYKWLHHEKSNRDLENEKLSGYIIKYHKKYNQELGYRAMADRINRDNNEEVFRAKFIVVSLDDERKQEE